jgi:hypothetical protein
VLARSIREEERPPINNSLLDSEHIYEEIRDQEEEEEAARMVAAAASRRPLPPLPPPASDISGRPSPTRQFDSLGREKKCIRTFLLRCKFFVFFRIMYLCIYLKQFCTKMEVSFCNTYKNFSLILFEVPAKPRPRFREN